MATSPELRRLPVVVVEPGRSWPDQLDTGPFTSMVDLAHIVRTLAEVARERAVRRENTLPVLAQFAGNALGAELEIQAKDLDRVLAAAGLSRFQPLHEIADRLPGAAARVAHLAVEIEKRGAGLLEAAAERLSPVE